MRKRPTLLGLMALIAYLAVGMAAIRSNDRYWAAGMMVLTASWLCVATLLAVHRRGASAGFAVCGWAWFLICQPGAAERGPASLSWEVTVSLVLHFTKAYRPHWSVSSGLSLSCVVVGLLGAIGGWLIDPGAPLGRRSEPNSRAAESATCEV
jgi:hypothetical protein